MRCRIWCALFLILAIFFSCGGSGGDEVSGTVEPSLVGSWVLFQVTAFGGTFTPESIDWAYRVTLRADGTYTIVETWQGSTESWTGRWGVDGNQLNLSDDGSGVFSLNGNVLTYDTADYDGEGNPGVLRFRRT